MNEIVSYLKLSDKPLRFESASQQTNVFFDESNCHVFTVRSGGAMGVVVKHPQHRDTSINFRMEDRGLILSIKFNPDNKILCVQRNTATIELMNFNQETNFIDGEYYQQCCKKSSSILGVIWTQINELAIITDHGVELYLVLPAKKSLKHVRTLAITVEWFLWCNSCKIALLGSSHGSQLQPVLFKPGNVTKLPKVEADPGRMVLESDVVLCELYGVASVLILRHHGGYQLSEIHVFTFTGLGQSPIKTHILRLGLSGKFACNIVDDLILVHHQSSKSSQIFDIAMSGDTDGIIHYHSCIAPARQIRDATFVVHTMGERTTYMCEMYSPNWFVFQPNVIIDEKLGCLWYVTVCLNSLLTLINDIAVCTQVCLHRTVGEEFLLEILENSIVQEKVDLPKIQHSFNCINTVYRNWAEAQVHSQISTPVNRVIPQKQTNLFLSNKTVISQDHIYQVLQTLNATAQFGNTTRTLDRIELVLVAYISSLYENGIYPQYNINELLISTMVKRNKFAALMQSIQYGVILDSIPIAYLLVSLSSMCPGTLQMAMDMLFRLNAKDDLEQLLLEKGDVLGALQLNSKNRDPKEYMESAEKTNNPYIVYTTQHYLRTKFQNKTNKT